MKRLLTDEHHKALRSLQSDERILLCKPDKGAGIVVMNKSDYINKMNDILADESKFKKMPSERDKTNVIEKAVSRLLSRLKQKGVIDNTTYERIRPTGSIIPRMYGLPKIHKPGLPLRPILDMCNSPYHHLAKWLVSVLEPLRKEVSKHSLKDSFEFIKQIENLNCAKKNMFSLDVASLFTNVPLVETIEYIFVNKLTEGI